MKPKFSLEKDTFVVENYNRSRPFSSFLPGISGEFGKPMWVFYTNRGQCVSSFGVRNKNGAMLEFYPANKAYIATPSLGFRTFLRFGNGSKSQVHEPFGQYNEGVQQRMYIRPHELELEETHWKKGIRIRVIYFGVPNEKLPVFVRWFGIENVGRRPLECELLDGLPQIVPYGLAELPLKQMARTMEAFSETVYHDPSLPLFKLKVEPSDKPDMERINGGFFAFTVRDGVSLPQIVDPQTIFGTDTGFSRAQIFEAGRRPLSLSQSLESLTACAFSHSKIRLLPGASMHQQSYFGHASSWNEADGYRFRVVSDSSYPGQKRQENAGLIQQLTGTLALQSGSALLNAYTRQAFLDNTLRGGQPYVVGGEERSQVFHYFSRKHGDMERDYNFFELSPTYFSQGNGNFRDVNQNRRSEIFLFPGVGAANIDTFFNLLQLDGYNPLVIQFEKFYLEPSVSSAYGALIQGSDRAGWLSFLEKPFDPGSLFEKLLKATDSREKALSVFEEILGKATKVQDAAHGEGFWIDHWTYNLDLLETFAGVYPDRLREVLFERKDFTYFDNDHVVMPRARKYVLRADGQVRQLHAVGKDAEKAEMIRRRREEPHKVRTKNGEGAIYRTTLLSKILGLIGIKAATLDPFGMGIEMEAEKPGWCDALNGLPGLIGSSMNETIELRRLVDFVQSRLGQILRAGESVSVIAEVSELLKSVQEVLALANRQDFFKTWDTLASLRESFRDRIRLGVAGDEDAWTAENIRAFLTVVAKTLDGSIERMYLRSGLTATYYINEVSEYEPLPVVTGPNGEKRPQTVRVKRFKQRAVAPFLEGPVHAMRWLKDPRQCEKLYNAVRGSALYDEKLGMYRLNAPLEAESFEIGRNKIFTPGWLENESIFLHMHYKFLLETARAGLAEQYFEDLKNGLVAFQDPKTYGRSVLENSSFIASSRFPDKSLHGTGFVARLTGATAEWISMVLHMGLGAEPFKVVNGELRFEPKPTIARWLFSTKNHGEFGKDTFAFKLFGRTWIVYQNPSRYDVYGPKAPKPTRFEMVDRQGKVSTHDGAFLPSTHAHALRDGVYARVTIAL